MKIKKGMMTLCVYLGLVGCESSSQGVMVASVQPTARLIEEAGQSFQSVESSFLLELLPEAKVQVLPVSAYETLDWIECPASSWSLDLLSDFMTTYLPETTSTGVLLQQGRVVVAFVPGSPVFHAWQLKGDLDEWPILLRSIGTTYPYLPFQLTTQFFQDAFLDMPHLEAEFLGTGLLLEEELIQFYPVEAVLSTEIVQTRIEDILSPRGVNMEWTPESLSLKVEMLSEDWLTEESLRLFLNSVLTKLVDVSGLVLIPELSIELVSPLEDEASSSVPLAQLDLTVHELMSRRWEGELTHALGEPLSYFRYYGAREFE